MPVQKALEELQRLRPEALKSARALLVANKLWRLCVDEGWPWASGEVQDSLEGIGLLYPKDMRADEESEQCENCSGDCTTCLRSVDLIESAQEPPK